MFQLYINHHQIGGYFLHTNDSVDDRFVSKKKIFVERLVSEGILFHFFLHFIFSF